MPERAMRLFGKMQQQGLQANVVACAAYQCIQPDVITYCPVIRPRGKGGMPVRICSFRGHAAAGTIGLLKPARQ